MPPTESTTLNQAVLPANAVRQARAERGDRALLPFLTGVAVILFTYFDVYHHYWFLKLFNGYVIKAWLSPAILLLLVTWRILRCGQLTDRLAGLKFPSLFLGAYILFGSISLAWNEDAYHAVKYSLVMFGPVLIYLASLLLLDTNAKIERILHALFWTGVLLSVLVFYMYEIQGYSSWVGEPFAMRWMWTQQEARETLGLNYYDAAGYFDYSRTLKLIDEPAFAAMLAPLSLFGFFLAARERSWKGWLYLIPSGFLLYTLIGTASRSSFIAFLAGLALYLWFIRKKRLQVLLIVIATAGLLWQQPFMLYRTGLLAGAALSRAVELTGGQSASPFKRSIDEWMKRLDDTVKKRMAIQKDGHIESVPETLVRARDYPTLGYGIGRLLAEHSKEGGSWHIEHNRYLFILSTSGLLTVIPYVLFLLSLLWLSRKAFPAGQGLRELNVHLGILLFPALVLFAIQINNCGQERYYYWVFFGLAAAWIRNMTRMESCDHSTH
jgi:hypothetical protein